MLASQLGSPISHFGSEKAGDLLAIKQKLGLPDERLGMKECQLCDLPDQPGGIAIPPGACSSYPKAPPAGDVESIVQAVTDAVMAALEAKSKA
jgi:L-fuculose-phosphate aldolase